MNTLNLITLGLASTSLGYNALILDGSLDMDYGSSLATQTVQTQFGDNFSELNAGYALNDGSNLHLLLTGNLEGNFNKLNIFIDSSPGGQNVIGGLNPTNDGWATKYNGFTFDAGFTADYILIGRNGNSNGNRFDLDIATLGTSNSSSYGDVFSGNLTGSASNLGNTGLGVAFDNSNTAGVAGGTAAANSTAANAVTTGLELSIPLSLIGDPTGEIRISAMVNGSNHDFLSNQFLGGLAAPQGNLGGDRNGNYTGDLSEIDLNNLAGQQFFTVSPIPEPSTALLSLSVLSLLGLTRRRR